MQSGKGGTPRAGNIGAGTWMGLTHFQHWSIQLSIRLNIEVHGDRWDRSHPFHLFKVIFNLPDTVGIVRAYRGSRKPIQRASDVRDICVCI